MRRKARSSKRWSKSTAATSNARRSKGEFSLDVTFAEGARRRVFARPREVVTVRTASDVTAAFARLDEALRDGYAIAGGLSYELGAAWNGVGARHSDGALMRVGIYDGSTIEPVPEVAGSPGLEPAIAGVSEAEYAASLAAIARSLLEGDVYQVNFTVPFRSRFAGDPAELFERLVRAARVPYAALLRAGDVAYVSLSPELFLAIEGDVVRTRPMKGTASAGDAASLATDKNRAEHVMIVDLLRNDLHRICRDVRVEAFETIETYPTFTTMTSTIAGRLRDDVGLEELFSATFPCGSVTGAPKRSAMQRIFELEKTPRGIAMGSIGYLEPAGSSGLRGWWNVAIRTLAIDRRTDEAELRVGGGIVADSTPESEWREISIKRRLFRSIEDPVGLIETMCAEDGVADVEPHLERLGRSAWSLGIDVDLDEVRARIREVVAAAKERMLLRIHVAPDGTVTVTTRPYDPEPAHPLVCIAPEALDARDPLLRYKTDRRDAYDRALSHARERGCFEAAILNTGGALADGARTSLFIALPDGRLATSRLEDGALDGIERRRLLASGRAVERRIDHSELHAGAAIRLASAARGVVVARIVS